jgi:hypothetical protein
MSIEPIKREVTQLLSQANEKVRASGALVFLKRQKGTLEARAAELNASRDSGGRTVVQEDWMVLMDRLDAFVDGR